jgi:hypothetical protein
LIVGRKGDFFEAIGRDGLLVGAVGHADGAEDEGLHDLGEGLVSGVDHDLLGDGEASAGVAEGAPGQCGDPDGFSICRLDAVEDLLEGGDGVGGGVAGEAVDVGAGGVGEEFAEGDGLLGGEVVLRECPGFELGLDGGVEGELALLDEVKGCHGGERFADGGGLKEAVGGGGCAGTVGVEGSPGVRPADGAVVNDCDADGRNVAATHLVGETAFRVRVARDGNDGEEAVFDGVNLGVDGLWG